MVDATLVFVPAGGGEADYQLTFELPGVPDKGDYISITRPDADGTIDFIVRRTWWHLHSPHEGAYAGDEGIEPGEVRELVVECAYAIGPYSTDQHERAAQGYAAGPEGPLEFEATAY